MQRRLRAGRDRQPRVHRLARLVRARAAVHTALHAQPRRHRTARHAAQPVATDENNELSGSGTQCHRRWRLPVRRSIDVEQLLQWAYRDELPKQGAQPFSPWERIFRYGKLGTRIDDQLGVTPRLPPVLGDPHQDALTIARHTSRLPHRSAVLVIIHAKMGTRPKPWEGPKSIFPVRDESRIRIVGKSYGRPRLGRGGAFRYYTEGSYCPLRFEPSLEEVAWSRAEWLCWRSGLVALVADLA